MLCPTAAEKTCWVPHGRRVCIRAAAFWSRQCLQTQRQIHHSLSGMSVFSGTSYFPIQGPQKTFVLTHNQDISRKKHFQVTVEMFSRLSAPLCRLTWESGVKHRGRKGSCNLWDLHVKIQFWLALPSSSLKKMYEPGFVALGVSSLN